MTKVDTHSSIPLPTDVAGGPAPTPAEEADVAPATTLPEGADVAPVVSRYGSGNESYAALVWRRFRR